MLGHGDEFFCNFEITFVVATDFSYEFGFVIHRIDFLR